MKAIFRVITLLVIVNSASVDLSAQSINSSINPPGPFISLPDRYGTAVPLKPYADVKGSPYLSADWSKGVVKLATGDIFKDVALKYNQIDGILTFKQGEKEMKFATPVSEFLIVNAEKTQRFKNGFPAIDTNLPSTYYEIVADGDVQLLKQVTKRVAEYKGYNQSIEKNIVSKTSFYVFKDDSITLIKPSSKSVVEVLRKTGIKVKDESKIRQVKDEQSLISLFS